MIGYLDLPSGLSGDMLLGCLIDCGWPAERLKHAIEQLDLPAGRWAVQVSEVLKGSLRAARVEVLVEEETCHRGLADITALIHAGALTGPVRDRAIAVFSRLASAEAKVHGTTPDKIHFHEVGALDAIVDIVGGIRGIAELGIETLYASPVPLGQGWIDSAHGRLPLPAPATLELLSAVGAPACASPGPGELLTPTAAALLAELATFAQPPMSVRRIGCGAGAKDFSWPNVARLWVGEPNESKGDGSMVQLETNIDDMNPQFYAATVEKLFAAGARDVWLTPVQMKKGRPGVVLSVLCRTSDEEELAGIILRETTTLGVRVQKLHHRHEVRREIRQLMTPFGEVRVKLKWIGRECAGAMPEYDDCQRLAHQAGVPVRRVHECAVAACQELLSGLSAAQRPTRV